MVLYIFVSCSPPEMLVNMSYYRLLKAPKNTFIYVDADQVLAAQPIRHHISSTIYIIFLLQYFIYFIVCLKKYNQI